MIEMMLEGSNWTLARFLTVYREPLISILIVDVFGHVDSCELYCNITFPLAVLTELFSHMSQTVIGKEEWFISMKEPCS